MKTTRTYPRPHIDTAPSNALGHAGGLLLTETLHASGLSGHLTTASARWKKPFSTHDPAKIVTDLALTLCLGGDALSDSSALRDEPDLYGRVAQGPTITRLIRTLATDTDRVLAAINTARAAARSRVWALAGHHAPNHDSDATDPLIIDIDATLVTAHSEKQDAAGTYKGGFGFHPLLSFVDHRRSGCGEPIAELIRPGNAGSTPRKRAVPPPLLDHIELITLIIDQLPDIGRRPGKSVLIRTDTAGGTPVPHEAAPVVFHRLDAAAEHARTPTAN